jgi:hypothetical protein
VRIVGSIQLLAALHDGILERIFWFQLWPPVGEDRDEERSLDALRPRVELVIDRGLRILDLKFVPISVLPLGSHFIGLKMFSISSRCRFKELDTSWFTEAGRGLEDNSLKIKKLKLKIVLLST